MSRTIKELEERVSKLERQLKTKKYGKWLKEGMFGYYECCKAVGEDTIRHGKTIQELYAEYISRALLDPMFNTMMIVAAQHLLKMKED